MGGVNPVLGERIGQAVSDFAARGSTVVIVEHNLPFIEHTCDVVVVMDLGSVIAEGPFASLRQDARVVSAYLGSEDSDV
jgi:ABC-type branched-subunit amino acid transport system ATPase component